MSFRPSAYSFGDAATGASTLSANGLAFLVKEEGIRRQVYNDKTGRTITSWDQATGAGGAAPGYPTIGMGLALLSDDLKRRYAPFLGGGRPMTDAELAASSREALEPRIRLLNSLLTRPVTQNQWDALFSFLYNRGSKGHNFPSAIAETNAGNPRAAAAYIAGAAAFETAPHIIGRRAREAALYLGSEAALAATKAATSGWVWLALGTAGAAAWWFGGNRHADVGRSSA